MAEHEYRTRVLRSSCLNPWLNLAYEELIFESVGTGDAVLFLWRNSESVVIGRYQNPWLECRLQDMKNDGIALARRFSGGGAVYHDLGNLNFTFVTDAESYDRQRNFSIVLNALKGLGIEAAMNNRNDIIVRGRKVSGSAFKQTRSRVCHHGTLLVSADLNRLRRYLKPHGALIESRGIKSVRSEVINLADTSDGIDVDRLGDAIEDSFFSRMGEGDSHLFSGGFDEAEGLAERYSKLKSREWIFGKSPDFTHSIRGIISLGDAAAELSVSGSLIAGAAISIDKPGGSFSPGLPEAVGEALSGRSYSRQAVLSLTSESSDLLDSDKVIFRELVRLIASEIPEI